MDSNYETMYLVKESNTRFLHFILIIVDLLYNIEWLSYLCNTIPGKSYEKVWKQIIVLVGLLCIVEFYIYTPREL